MNDLFYNITPDNVIRAFEKIGLEPTGHCMALNSFENRVYDIRLESDEHVIAKFYRPGRWSIDQIMEEHDFLFELQEHEIPVCAPLLFSDGKTIHTMEGVHFAVWPRTGGRSADEFSNADLETLGRLIARIHNIGDSKKSPHRLIFGEQTYAYDPLNYMLENNYIPNQFTKRYRAAVMEIAELYSTLSRGVPLHRIHGDCHTGNLLHGKEGWYFLDFDDFLTGPAVQDIWMLFPMNDIYGNLQMEVFLDSYRQFRNFDNAWLDLIEPLRALRYIHYTGWIARRWKDPIFPLSFPQFGTDRYWEEATADLEDQLKIIHSSMKNKTSIHSLMNHADHTGDETELTNADFFWDMKEE